MRLALLVCAAAVACTAEVAIPVEIEGFSRTYPATCVIDARPSNPIPALAFHPDGKTLASSGYGEVLLWDLEGAKLVRRIDVSKFGASVRSLAFSREGALAIAAGTPGRKGAVLLASEVLAQSDDEFLAVAFSADGQWLAAGASSGAVQIWDTAAKKLAATLKEHGGTAAAVAFSPDGKYFATGSGDRTVRIYHAGSWESVVVLPATLTEPVTSLAFSPDGDFLAFAVSGVSENAVRIWRTSSAAPAAGDDARAAARRAVQIKQTRPLDTGAGGPLAIAWGKPPLARQARPRLFAAGSDQKVKVLAANGQVVIEMAAHTDWVHAVAIRPDGWLAASAGGDGTVRLWNALDGRLLATLVQVSPRKDDWVIVTPRGHFAASSSKVMQWRTGAAGGSPEELARGLDDAARVRSALAARAAARRALR